MVARVALRQMQKFTVEQVRDYYRNYYSPNNATLVIVGDFETESTLSAVKEILAKYPRKRAGRESRGSREVGREE